MGAPLSGAALLAAHGAQVAATAYVAPLVAYTQEDAEAKGLRKLEDPAALRPPVHFSALEMVRDEPTLLLTAPLGGGKSCFALELALSLAGENLGDASFNRARLARMVARNDQGLLLLESWDEAIGGATYWALQPGDDPRQAPCEPDALLVLDNIEVLGMRGPQMLSDLMARGLHLLALGESEACCGWALPNGMATHTLLSTSAAPVTPASPPEPDPAQFEAWSRGERRSAPHLSQGPRALQAAATLTTQHPQAIAALFKSDPELWRLPVTLAAGWSDDPRALAMALGSSGAQGAVLGAQIARDPVMVPALLAALTEPALPAHRRNVAGRHLAALGDPRDLEKLITIPAGRVTMGGDTHPNAAPAHVLDLAGFRIGRFPVSNRLYAQFISDTGLMWRSPDGHDPERDNAPAVDLTWHDANAFCRWLTIRWRREERIGARHTVRLPSEPEWEYAARGCQPARPGEEAYPWAGPWVPDRANALEAGFNTTTALGLFPRGASPFGVEDMTGQVWEWTSTLWGSDPAKPAKPYPWHPQDDAAAPAPANIRRVLRGGCFSSHQGKATCTYRGSLEPGGFWRGNGFRIVVS